MKNKIIIRLIYIELIIALIIFLPIKESLTPKLQILYGSFLVDFLLPFGFYFLMIIASRNISLLKKWWLRVIILFTAVSTAELLQYFGIYALGSTFDPYLVHSDRKFLVLHKNLDLDRQF